MPHLLEARAKPRSAPDRLQRSQRGDVPAHEIAGPAGAPVIIALGGISATRHVVATNTDPSRGWWEPVVGPGGAIDTTQFRVLGVDFLDGGRGADRRPRQIVTTPDQADAVASVLDLLGVERVHAFVGASYGGMVALAFAERYPARLERLVAISAPHEAHPMSTALRALQRQVVRLGLDTGHVAEGLSIARGLAMTTYRSAREFGERFDSRPVEQTGNDAVFPVERYLRHHGERFATRWSAERFLSLSLSGDLHRVDPAAIRAPAVVVAAEGDSIVPGEQLRELVGFLGGPATLVELPTTRGHDAFLTEPAELGRILRSAISTSILS